LTIDELFRDRVNSEIEKKSEDVSSGCASDYSDYRYRIGVIEGLIIAKREFLEILKNYEDS